MGKLYVVATPIGNLGDISFRAVEILKNVQFILAEDTRVSKRLLKKYQIHTQLVSYRDQNHARVIEKIHEKLDLGLDLALISDAGTPGISDPGYKLISELKRNGYEIVPVPGPNAAIAALSVSGLPTDKFIFLGFLPKSDGKRLQILGEYMELEASVILYESPNRIIKLLQQIGEIDNNRKICVAIEITKLHEKIVTGDMADVMKTLAEISDSGNLRGEFVVIIQKAG
ncbi:16S rRNA (cytidine(1402)-2'-O)-methyltransferase [Candidatus Dojkabacteria bacterium]|nr:16S rRNA (cytidine(1402)-2'-O)-methyltransferase [Candidatus Dojkabacteria bacterium]